MKILQIENNAYFEETRYFKMDRLRRLFLTFRYGSVVQVTWKYIYYNDLNQFEAKINVEHQFGLFLLGN